MSDITGRSVVVTGADGFIGSHLVERLVHDGAHVRALCVYNSDGRLGWLDEFDPDVLEELDVRLGDVRDAELMAALVEGADLVFHLAALIAIPYSYVAPRSFVETNVIGTLNVLEGCKRAGVGRLVNTSTSEVYGTPETVPITEDHPLRGQSPYSASKIAADKLCESFALSFGMPVVTLRPFNTFGPRQSARAVIPTIVGQLLAGAAEVRLGNLSPERDFTYVTDTVDGFVRMAMADVAPGTTIQLGTGSSISVGDLLALCCDITGVDAGVALESERVRPDGSEVEILRSDPARAHDELGWAPAVDLREGLKRVAAWLDGRVDLRRAGRYQR